MTHLPYGWKSDRLKDVALVNALSLPANTNPGYEFDYLEISNVDYYGVIDRRAIERLRFEDAPSRARRCVRSGNTLISSVRPNLQAVAFMADVHDVLVCSTGFNVVQPNESKLWPKFAYYALISEAGRQYFDATAKGVGYPAVDDKDFNTFTMSLPPLPEQNRIAAYLDASCAAIDAAVAAKRRQIETLKALRKSIIQKAMTKGLNPSTIMRCSGNDGLGEIPSHWKTDRMKDVVNLRNEKTDLVSEDADYLELEDIESGTGRILNRRNTLDVESAVTIFKKGDILFGKLRPYLEKYFHADFDGKCTGEILAFDPIQVSSRFLFYCIASPWFIEQCNTLAYGAKMPRVNWQTQLAVFIMPLPPAKEQTEICDYLDTKLNELSQILMSIETQISTLTAYRKSLIHECVTGQRRITEADVARAQMTKRADKGNL